MLYRFPNESTPNHMNITFGNAVALCYRFVVFLALQATNFVDLVWRKFAASTSVDIYCSSHWLQVVRVHASAIAAKMVKFHTFRNWPLMLVVKVAMSCKVLIQMMNATVSSFVCSTIPNPAASIRINGVAIVIRQWSAAVIVWVTCMAWQILNRLSFYPTISTTAMCCQRRRLAASTSTQSASIQGFFQGLKGTAHIIILSLSCIARPTVFVPIIPQSMEV